MVVSSGERRGGRDVEALLGGDGGDGAADGILGGGLRAGWRRLPRRGTGGGRVERGGPEAFSEAVSCRVTSAMREG